MQVETGPWTDVSSVAEAVGRVVEVPEPLLELLVKVAEWLGWLLTTTFFQATM